MRVENPLGLPETIFELEASLVDGGVRPYRIVEKRSTFLERMRGAGETQISVDLTDEEPEVQKDITNYLYELRISPNITDIQKSMLDHSHYVGDARKGTARIKCDDLVTANQIVYWLERQKLGTEK